MPLKAIWRGYGNGRESKASRQTEWKWKVGRGRSDVAPERLPLLLPELDEESPWEDLPSDLLFDIIKRVEASDTSWPSRRDVVSCAAVCRAWRETTKQIVRTPEQCGLLTFPKSLKQPGPRDSPIHCYIKRDRATSTFELYLGLVPGGDHKLLLTAYKIRRIMCTEFLISLSSNDFSPYSDTCVGKLRSNFLGAKFALYDFQSPLNSGIKSNDWLHKRFMGMKVPVKAPAGNNNVAAISYDVNVLHNDGPRKMQCTLHSIPSSALEVGSATKPEGFGKCNDYRSCSSPHSAGRNQEFSSNCTTEPTEFIHTCSDPLTLRNISPKWHEQLQCWCLNFKGRATVASVKNFQLVAAVGESQNMPLAEPEKVILQFGKIGKDIFTMDYCYPLSAFQAFAICLSSFGTKLACD
nr:tubby-like F-box protein 5 [Ipomoea batatas]